MTESAFASRLSDIIQLRQDDNRKPLRWASGIAEAIEGLLGQIDLPPKDEVLAMVQSSLRKVWAAVDVPGPDVLVEPMLEQLILFFVGRAYDRIASE